MYSTLRVQTQISTRTVRTGISVLPTNVDLCWLVQKQFVAAGITPRRVLVMERLNGVPLTNAEVIQ